MTDAQLAAIVGVAMTFGATTVKLVTWIVKQILENRKELAAAATANSDKMVAALLDQARSNAQLGGKIDSLVTKLDEVGRIAFETKSGVTAIPEEMRELRTAKHRSTPAAGSPLQELRRSPRPGTRNEDDR